MSFGKVQAEGDNSNLKIEFMGSELNTGDNPFEELRTLAESMLELSKLQKTSQRDQKKFSSEHGQEERKHGVIR